MVPKSRLNDSPDSPFIMKSLPNRTLSSSALFWLPRDSNCGSLKLILTPSAYGSSPSISTILGSRLSVSPGEKVTFDFNWQGRGERIGISYTGASNGVNGAQDTIGSALFYNTQEVIKELKSALDVGTLYTAPSPDSRLAAELLCRRFGIDQIRFSCLI